MSKLQLTNGFGPAYIRHNNDFFESLTPEGTWTRAGGTYKISIDMMMSRKVAGFEDGYQRTVESTQTALSLLKTELKQIMFRLAKTAERPNEFDLGILNCVNDADAISTYDDFCIKYRNIPILFVNDINLIGMANRLFEYDVTYDPYSKKYVGHVYRMLQNVDIVLANNTQTLEDVLHRTSGNDNAPDFTQMLALNRYYKEFPNVRFNITANFDYWKNQVKLIDAAAALYEPVVAEFKAAAGHLNASLRKANKQFEIIKEAM